MRSFKNPSSKLQCSLRQSRSRTLEHLVTVKVILLRASNNNVIISNSKITPFNRFEYYISQVHNILPTTYLLTDDVENYKNCT